jgi:hypothetical protein
MKLVLSSSVPPPPQLSGKKNSRTQSHSQFPIPFIPASNAIRLGSSPFFPNYVNNHKSSYPPLFQSQDYLFTNFSLEAWAWSLKALVNLKWSLSLISNINPLFIIISIPLLLDRDGVVSTQFEIWTGKCVGNCQVHNSCSTDNWQADVGCGLILLLHDNIHLYIRYTFHLFRLPLQSMSHAKVKSSPSVPIPNTQ